VRLTSRGAVIYSQRRVGRGGVPFTILKFRTMHDEAEMATGPVLATKDDPRVTPLGRLLRATRLDELPQLWNVLRGDMSLVGPRPPIPYEVEHYPPHWFDRFAVKPGMTGLWQVNGRSELGLEEMIALDVEYARTRSLWLNVKILARTVPVVFAGRGAA
jgi:lipopolysaccharide/colanic/teichoic acid biosynthesis glycosyltransferase